MAKAASETKTVLPNTASAAGPNPSLSLRLYLWYRLCDIPPA